MLDVFFQNKFQDYSMMFAPAFVLVFCVVFSGNFKVSNLRSPGSSQLVSHDRRPQKQRCRWQHWVTHVLNPQLATNAGLFPYRLEALSRWPAESELADFAAQKNPTEISNTFFWLLSAVDIYISPRIPLNLHSTGVDHWSQGRQIRSRQASLQHLILGMGYNITHVHILYDYDQDQSSRITANSPILIPYHIQYLVFTCSMNICII